jgi:hypothetical protein
LPKFTLDGVMVSPACTPLAVKGITAELPCVLVTVTFPVTDSAALGLNVRFTAAFCPGASIMGIDIPLAVTSVALTLICEMVTLVFPLFVTVTLFEVDFPALTLPKLTFAGFAEIVTSDATPVPLKTTAFGEFGALLKMLTLPPWLPAVVGANSTLNAALFPTPIV